VRRQADFFALERVKELAMPTIFDYGKAAEPDGTPRAPMQSSQLLLVASALAAQTNVSRIIWPAACDASAAGIALAQEVLTLVGHLAQAEGFDRLRIDTPLLSLTDRQVIELGVRLGVMWSAAWVCVQDGPVSCEACTGCRRRWKAFESAGVHSDWEGASGGRVMRAA
jgi:7-cyano-7-deazaguanine synthase in queuosine biosynthesis